VAVAAVLETLFWAYLVVGGLADQLPFAQGYGEVAAVLGTLVFVPLVLPALVLALAGRALTLATVLAGAAGLLYAMDFLYRLDSVLDAVPVSGVLGLGLMAALIGFGVALALRKWRT
jgi:hypothetical protein